MRRIHVFAHPLQGGFVNQTIALKLCLKFRIRIIQSLVVLVYVLRIGIIEPCRIR